MSKKLYRSTTNKMICGVCGGLGEMLGIDPTIIRFLWALLSVCTALFGGLILYIVAAIIIPQDPGYTDV